MYRITILKPCESNKLLRLLDLFELLGVIVGRKHNSIGQVTEFLVHDLPVQFKKGEAPFTMSVGQEDFLPNGISIIRLS